MESDFIVVCRLCKPNYKARLPKFRRIHRPFRKEFRPHRNPMPPPKLAADAPILHAAHPVVVNFRPAVGKNFISPFATPRGIFPRSDISKTIARSNAARSAHRRVRCSRRCSCKALPFPARPVRVSFSTATLRALKRSRPRKSAPAASFIGRPPHDFDLRELVAQTDFKVRLVVRGRHFQHAGAEFKIHMLVADDGNELLCRAAIPPAADARRVCR
jgi:hypothetical protein